MRAAAAIIALVVAVVVGVAARATASLPRPVVPCADIIGQAKSGDDSGYRLVLGIVSVPRARLRQVVATHTTPWAYWRKAGLVIRASHRPVRVSVPEAWRKRAAISWGNSTAIVSSLRIAACPSPPNVWNAYAGGFYIRSRSACVPLTFQVGQRSETVRFGIGRSCGAAT